MPWAATNFNIAGALLMLTQNEFNVAGRAL
jgi:hypothetical protein